MFCCILLDDFSQSNIKHLPVICLQDTLEKALFDVAVYMAFDLHSYANSHADILLPEKALNGV